LQHIPIENDREKISRNDSTPIIVKRYTSLIAISHRKLLLYSKGFVSLMFTVTIFLALFSVSGHVLTIDEKPVIPTGEDICIS
jgi:hypothetical protein